MSLQNTLDLINKLNKKYIHFSRLENNAETECKVRAKY